MYRRMIVWILFLLALLIPIRYIYRYIEIWQQQFGISRPNVLIITLDTCRADSLGGYGNPVVYSAVLDRVCKRSVQFRRAYSPIPTTGPAHTSIMTGLLPAHHRVFRNAMPYHQSAKTMATVFHDLGYRTGAFISGYSVTNRVSNLGSGFDIYDDSWSKTMLERPGMETVKSFDNWIDGVDGTPFFAWVHLFDMHSPYSPSGVFSHMLGNAADGIETYTSDQVTKYNSNVRKALDKKDFNVLVKDPGTLSADSETVQSNRIKYWEELCYVDRCVEHLIHTLNHNRKLPRTLVIVTADHGEGFDHSYYFAHGDRLWDSAVSVPLMIQYPEVSGLRRLVTGIGTLQDIFPTVMAIAAGGLYVHPVDGENLVRIMKYGMYREDRTGFIVAPPLPRKEMSQGLLIAAYDPEYKLIWNDRTQKGELYDIAADPGELQDVSRESPSVKKRLMSRIKVHRRIAKYPENSQIGKTESSEKERLIQLGYIRE